MASSVWHNPDVVDRSALVDPFFVRTPFPLVLGDDLLTGDGAAINFLELLDEESNEFIYHWDRMLQAGTEMHPDDMRDLLQTLKNKADCISASAASTYISPEHFSMKSSFRDKLESIVIQKPISHCLSYVIIVCCSALSILVSTLGWVLWKKPSILFPLFITLFMVLQLLFILMIFYFSVRRAAVSNWLSRELTTNFSKEFFSKLVAVSENNEMVNVELHLVRKNCGVSQTVVLPEVALHHRVVIIGFKETLEIVAWNTAASELTGLPENEVIGESLALLLDHPAIMSIKELISTLTFSKEDLQVHISSASGTAIPIVARISPGTLSASPILLLTGTLLGSQDEYLREHYSFIGTSLILRKLATKGIVKPNRLALLVEQTSWAKIKELANRQLTEVSASRLIQEVDENSDPNRRVRVVFEQDIRPFLCDKERVKFALRTVIDSIVYSGVKEVIVRLKLLRWTRQALEVRIDLPEGGKFESFDKICSAVHSVGYIYMYCETKCIELLFPIIFSLQQTRIDHNEGGTAFRCLPCEADANNVLLCFIVFGSGLHASYLNRHFSCEHHRFVRIETAEALRKELRSNGDKVSAVLIPEVDPQYEELAQEVKNHLFDIVVASLTTKSKGSNWVSPISPTPYVDTHLELPIDADGWGTFLQLVFTAQNGCRLRRGYSFKELRVIKELSSTENSKVELVEDMVTQGRMVRKTIFDNREQARKEIRIMNHIEGCPHAIRCLDSQLSTPTSTCIFYRYCPSGNLKTCIVDKGNFLTLDEVVPYAIKLLKALKYIHSKGVAHRDIKPENIFMDEHNKVFLGDFSSATDEPMQDSFTGRTIGYVPPERIVDIKVKMPAMQQLYAGDIWSLGLTLLELIDAYPEELRHLSINDMLSFFTKKYNDNKEIEFDLRQYHPQPQFTGDASIKFFSHMLQIDPSKRRTAEELLHLPFLNNSSMYQS